MPGVRFVVALALAAQVLAGCGGARPRRTCTGCAVPPPLLEEAVLDRPGLVWIHGHWARDGAGWRWIDGAYARERPGLVYRDGCWTQRGDLVVWVEGAWLPPPRSIER